MLSAAGVETEPAACEWADIELKYAGYLARERQTADRLSRMESLTLPNCLDYEVLATLSSEAREKLKSARPSSLGQASRIPGVSRSDLQSLVMEVLKLRNATA